MSRLSVQFACLGLLLIVCPFAHADTPTKILFIGKEPDHPYGSHMYMHVSGVLAKCVELTPGVEAIVSNGWPKDSATLQGVRAIVVYTNPGAEFLLDSPYREDFEKLMESGVGLVTVHWATAIRQEDLDRLGRAWIGYLGGFWVSNVGLSKGESTLTQLMPEHPICRGWEEYIVDDEYYLNPTIKTAKPFLRIADPRNNGREVFVAWLYERPDNGRTFSTTLGHPYRNFQREPFRRMLVNAILWSAGEEIPQHGADVKLSEDDLALPPKDQ